MADSCLFCKIGRGEVSSETVFEDADVRVFKDIHPKAPVHLLVVPKRHIESIAHLEHDHVGVIESLVSAAKETARKQGLAGYKLVFNVGREGGQMIDHLHLHILGGWGAGESKNIANV